MTDMIHTNPQGLYSSLLSPETLAKMPKEFVEHMLPILKNALVTSLHQVFVIGLVFVLLGAVLTLFIGNIKVGPKPNKKNAKLKKTFPQVSLNLSSLLPPSSEGWEHFIMQLLDSFLLTSSHQ